MGQQWATIVVAQQGAGEENSVAAPWCWFGGKGSDPE